MAKRRGGNAWVAAKNKAKREGWLKEIRNESDERALVAGCYFNKRRAEHVVEFFPRYLRHYKGRLAGKPFRLDDWQEKHIIRPVFGWVRIDEHGDEVRRFRTCYVEVPKKNGKSTLCAGVGCYMLGADGERGADVFSVGVDREQASIVHSTAVEMVLASPLLMRDFKVHHSTHRITFPQMRGRWRALAGKAAGNEGLDASCFIADEVHVWRGRKLFDAIRFGIAARPQPLFFMITTAGDDKQSVCFEQHQHARSVNAGEFEDEQFFGFIAAADETKDDLMADEALQKANPGWGQTVSPIEIRSAREAAKRTADSWNAFKRYRMNVWVTGTSPAINEQDWKDCRVKDPEARLAELIGKRCVAALDLSRTEDSTSLQLVFPDVPDISTHVTLLSYFLYPEQTAEAERLKGRVPWWQWAEDPSNNLTLVPGRTIKDSDVIAKLHELNSMFEIETFVSDPMPSSDIMDHVENEMDIETISFAQTMKNYAEPSSRWEQMILDQQLEHLGNPIMDWQVRNLEWKTDNNANKRPVKRTQKDYRKVDGPVASIMGVGVAVVGSYHEDSAYSGEDDGVILI